VAGELAGEGDVARLLGLLELEGVQAEHARGLALRSPAERVRELVASIEGGEVSRSVGLVLERLRSVAV
jgi:hypothetical protein